VPPKPAIDEQDENRIAFLSATPRSHSTEPSTLEDGTPIRLRLTMTVSSSNAAIGDSVDFQVLHDVNLDNMVAIPRGARATGTIGNVEHRRLMGRGAKLDVKVDEIKLTNGQEIPLRAAKEASAGRSIYQTAVDMTISAHLKWTQYRCSLFMVKM
jgi:hypothetical protein